MTLKMSKIVLNFRNFYLNTLYKTIEQTERKRFHNRKENEKLVLGFEALIAVTKNNIYLRYNSV
jgi:hypothetical protein